jgi:hypothetical protein
MMCCGPKNVFCKKIQGCVLQCAKVQTIPPRFQQNQQEPAQNIEDTPNVLCIKIRADDLCISGGLLFMWDDMLRCRDTISVAASQKTQFQHSIIEKTLFAR